MQGWLLSVSPGIVRMPLSEGLFNTFIPKKDAQQITIVTKRKTGNATAQYFLGQWVKP